MTRNVFTLGETVLDILFRNHEPFTAKAGGSCLNSSVSLGRLGIKVQFISEYGLDEVGNFVDAFLTKNKVNTAYVYRYFDGKSALALAFLNENNDASYDFYKVFPKNRLNIAFPEIKKNDIVLFGSFYSLTKEVRPQILSFIKQAKKNKAIIIYDPNFRKPHLHKLKELRYYIEENISYADIIRGSNEDFSLIFGVSSPEEAFKACHDKNKILVYTANKNGVYLHTPHFQKHFDVPVIKPVSTIGAGDNFNAGIIYSLLSHSISHKQLTSLSSDIFEDIVHTGIQFASEACMSYENYLSEDFINEFKKGKP